MIRKEDRARQKRQIAAVVNGGSSNFKEILFFSPVFWWEKSSKFYSVQMVQHCIFSTTSVVAALFWNCKLELCVISWHIWVNSCACNSVSTQLSSSTTYYLSFSPIKAKDISSSPRFSSLKKVKHVAFKESPFCGQFKMHMSCILKFLAILEAFFVDCLWKWQSYFFASFLQENGIFGFFRHF